ncbi:hypothetical protein D3C76_1724730 [compost metagenome]
MYIFIIIISVIVIMYWISKKKKVKLSLIEWIKGILWIEANIFLIAYFITDDHYCKIAWQTFMVLACIVTLIPRKK